MKKNFKRFIKEGERWQALKKAVKIHARNQRQYIHGNDPNPKTRAKKNLGYYASHIIPAAGAALTVGNYRHDLLVPSAIGATAGLLYPHIKQIKKDYKYVRNLQKKKQLKERVRTPEQATKLGNYLAKRHGGTIKLKPYDSNKSLEAFASASSHISKKNKKYHEAMFDAPEHNIPIKNLKFSQHQTIFSTKGAKWKLKDKEPIEVVKHKGEHFITNGHHRVIAHKLLGKTHIKAKVLEINE